MKKWILVTSVLLFLAIAFVVAFVFNKEDYVQLDLVEDSDPQAAETLYNYELKTNNLTAERAKNEFHFSKENFFAVYFDLNDDGEEEIIGFANARYFCGSLGCGLDILQKDKNEYKNISQISIEPVEPILFVSNKKTNGYKNIKCSSDRPIRAFIGIYHDGQYATKEQIKKQNSSEKH